MDANELRALADAIVYRDSLAIARAADYLRALADAQPVAWRYWLVDDDEQDWSIATHRDGCENAVRVEPLYTHPAPAEPQAEPKRDPLSDEPPRGFVRWVRNNMPPNTVISNPDWWAMQLWRAAMRAHGIGGSDAGTD